MIKHGARLVVLSAPSGAGKSSICRLLLERNPNMKLSISATTREPRNTEQDGVDYIFLSEEIFLTRVKQQEFLEYENVHGNHYGTLKSTIEALMSEGYIVLFDIDVNGALNIKRQYPEALLIFIRPPSFAELERRLKNRKTETPEVIQRRLARLPEECRKGDAFDLQVVNNVLLEATQEIEKHIGLHLEKNRDVTD